MHPVSGDGICSWYKPHNGNLGSDMLSFQDSTVERVGYEWKEYHKLLLVVLKRDATRDGWNYFGRIKIKFQLHHEQLN